MKASSLLTLALLLVFFLDQTRSHWWGRRRRRRRTPPQPPPEPNCVVSDWSSWSKCTPVCATGTQTRTRFITYYPSPHCQKPSLTETQNCGAVNGGCQEICNMGDGTCSCRAGYILASDGKSCLDKDECQSNGGRGPCSHTCTNSPGSYACLCPSGYILGADLKTCERKDCLNPQLPSCPIPVYSDHIGKVCEKVTVTCLSGTRLNAQCQFSCPQDFRVAKITDFSLPFAKVVSRSSFHGVISSTTCVVDAVGNVAWTDVDVYRLNYFCRRVNDPPSDIKLSKTTLKEHSAIGTVVANLSVEIPSNEDSITYSLQQSPGEYFFQVQGNQLLNSWIPRWNNLQGLKINDYRIVIRATDNGSPPMWLDKPFNITVVNVNDPPYDIRISNNSVMDTATLNHVVGVLSAVDYDGPRGALRSSDFIWTLVDDDKGRFSLQGPSVVVAASLDHQAHQYHRIIVNCADKDLTNPRSVQVSIIMNVIDTNDSPKDIRFTPYRLYENSTAGFTAGSIVASDEDGDTLAFSLSQSDGETLATFELGRTACVNKTVNGIVHAFCSASLILKRSIDYETKNSYPLKITATDPNGGFTVGEFVIHVVNLNEVPTDISLSSDSVPENSPVGTFIGQLTVTDPDTSQRSHQGHVCSVSPSKPFGISGFNLIVSEDSLNFESKSSYKISITCTDTGAPPLSLSKDFIIKVEDRNERPEYLMLTHTSIQENAPIGSTVGQLLTRDPDVNTQSLTFHIRSPVNSPFQIGGTGNSYLVTRSKLDYETLQEVDLLIGVTDNGGLSFEKYFKITILDVNEAPTDILLTAYSLQENSPPGAIISPITVIDPDFNSTASCRIIAGDSQHLAVFASNLVAGNKMVDYEALGSSKNLQVTLRCTDEFGLYLDKAFHIDVTDVNEPPTGIEIALRQIPENKINAAAGQLIIRDPDTNDRYSCKVVYNGTDSLLFDVDAVTMMLKTRRPLNFEVKRQHLITVRCSDHVPANYSTFTIFKDVEIDVIDVNETPLNPCQQEILVDEAVSDGYVVWTFEPHDPDNERYEIEKRLKLSSAYPKQLLSVSMTSGHANIPFHIVEDTYLVKSGNLNRTAKDQYDLNLNVTDDGMLVRLTGGKYERYQGPIISALHTCKIRILASDDQRLRLDIALSHNTISEDSLNGTKVGTVSMVNPQPGKTYRFSLLQPGAVPFKLVGNDLILVIGTPLDYETTNSTGVGILAIDSDGTTIQRLFEIRITNVNERPVKMCLFGNKTVLELQNTDQVIGQIFIEDEDHKETKRICESSSPSLKQAQSYTCGIESNVIDVTPAKQIFYVDDKLVLHGNTTFDFKEKRQYIVPLMCRDKTKPIHVTELVVTINVIESSSRPTWDFILSSNTVSEDATNGTEIGTLSVTNGQSGYTFSVIDARKPFRIVGTKLLLVNSQPLDYETSNSTTVLITSTNNNGIQVTKSFTILITNVNERPVDLCLLDSVAVIPEKSPADTVIGRIAIEDPDHPESKDICKKSPSGHVVQYLTYTCEIYSSSASVVDVKTKFYIDQNFQLNRKSDFDYNTKSTYNIPITCRDKLKPIHLIERTFVVNIQAPSCQPGFKFSNGVCVCSNGLSGPKCDRDPYICSYTICLRNEVCLSHVNASLRCVQTSYQVPILMQLPFAVGSILENRYKIEGYVESIFEGRRPAGQTLNSLFNSNVVSRRKREIPKDVYVEGASWMKVLSFHTYAIFVAMDPQLKYKALPGTSMCSLLEGTDLRCVNEQDCELLRQANIECPYVFGGTDGNKGKSKANGDDGTASPVIYGVTSVGVIIIVIAVLVFFVLRRRKKSKKSDEPVYFHDMQEADTHGLDNPVYGEISPDDSPQMHPANARRIIQNNLLNQASAKRPSDIKTFENKLYGEKRLSKFDRNNPVYDVVSSTSRPYQDDHLYESVGKRLGKDTVNVMLEEEKKKAHEKGIDEEIVALPSNGKRKDPEYVAGGNLTSKKDGKHWKNEENKQDNRKYAEGYDPKPKKGKDSTC